MMKKSALILSLIGSSAGFVLGAADVLDQVPAAKDYQLVYQKDLATIGEDSYTTDNTAKITKPFDRIAYCLELQKAGEANVKYVFVSMDAFSKDLKQIGVPRGETKFQQPLTNLEVYSNVEGVKTGKGINGNIEFWATDYSPANAVKVPGASDTTYDFGDTANTGGRYGSMQIHNTDAQQTVFAVNGFKSGGEMGIGNCPGQHPDWTFAKNSGTYSVKTLRVFVNAK